MKIPIGIFEDNNYDKLYPLTQTCPVFDLRCGIFTLKEKIQRQFPDHPLVLFCRGYLEDYIQSQNPDVQVNRLNSDSCLFINGRLLFDSEIARLFDVSEETVYLHQSQITGAFLKDKNLIQFVKTLKENTDPDISLTIRHIEVKRANLINYPWELVHYNPSEIERDFNSLNKQCILDGNVSEDAILVNEKKIYLGKNSVIKPGAILDADNGPIWIGEGATVMHNAVIEGPAFIGDGSTIKIGAKIYEGTSIGEVCKVGGEVEESIIHSYSNKRHDGFLGHAYLGQWVNLGADTNNSDLKNNYGNVKVWVRGVMIDSGSMFIGLTMGDHSKTGINTMFNTGTTVGPMCNVYGAGFPPKYIPAFSWGGSEGLVEHELDKALDTARQVMARRKQVLSPAYESIFRYIFEETRNERSEYK
jgi:UDP-N-acetylglucosamine diphosphorylase/glucosamine-1-phosphate N-acetyltransferase